VTAESGTRWLLRFIGITTIPAFVAAILPQPWLIHLINEVDPGASTGILMTYLARMLMAMYAFVGIEAFIFASDVRRYRPLILILGAGGAAVALIGLLVLLAAVSSEGRTRVFWIVFIDFAEGFAHTLLLAILIRRVPTGQAMISAGRSRAPLA